MKKQTKKHLKRQQGFSAPEILVVMLIMGIMAVLAIPNISRTMELRKLDTYVSTVSGKISEARSYAIKNNRTVWLRVDPIDRTIQMQSTADAVGTTINLKPSKLFPANIDMVEVAAVEFHFDSMGRLTTGSETVTFELSGSRMPALPKDSEIPSPSSASVSTNTQSIRVEPAGKITVGSMQ